MIINSPIVGGLKSLRLFVVLSFNAAELFDEILLLFSLNYKLETLLFLSKDAQYIQLKLFKNKNLFFLTI